MLAPGGAQQGLLNNPLGQRFRRHAEAAEDFFQPVQNSNNGEVIANAMGSRRAPLLWQ